MYPTAHSWAVTPFLLAGALAMGCGETNHPRGRVAADQAPTAAAPAAVAPSPGPETSPGPIEAKLPGPAPTERRFAVRVTPAAQWRAGNVGQVDVSLTAMEPWHVNLDYPTSLELAGPATVRAERDVYEKRHAARLTEQGFQYEVALTPTEAGEQSFHGTLKFAVCEEDACVPVKTDIDFVIAVQ